MEKFQGWTPATIDNRTFDQLYAIFNEFVERDSKKKGKDINIKGVPSVKMTKKETDAWIEAGYPSPVEKFLSKYRKK
jgi:hypothetical protein